MEVLRCNQVLKSLNSSKFPEGILQTEVLSVTAPSVLLCRWAEHLPAGGRRLTYLSVVHDDKEIFDFA